LRAHAREVRKQNVSAGPVHFLVGPWAAMLVVEGPPLGLTREAPCETVKAKREAVWRVFNLHKGGRRLKAHHSDPGMAACQIASSA
jgi:hypothetical protein